MMNPELGYMFDVPVFYTDEFIESSVFDFAYSSVHGGFLPYLFVGYFTDGKGFNKWFFSNCRRHEEMRQAIESDLGAKYNYTYGQMWFNSLDLAEGRLRFDRLNLYSELPDKQKAERLLRSVINPKYLDNGFGIVWPE